MAKNKELEAVLEDLKKYVKEAQITSDTMRILRDAGVPMGEDLGEYIEKTSPQDHDEMSIVAFGRMLGTLQKETEDLEGRRLKKVSPPGKYPAEWVIKEAKQETLFEGE